MAERITLNQRKKSNRSAPVATLSELKRQALPYRSWYKLARWVRERATFLLENPLCSDYFGIHGVVKVIATIVDHIKPHKGDWDLFWDQGNWQSMCKPCHDRKTAVEDGGLGRKLMDRDVVPC